MVGHLIKLEFIVELKMVERLESQIILKHNY
jgi:hypothetical protein